MNCMKHMQIIGFYVSVKYKKTFQAACVFQNPDGRVKLYRQESNSLPTEK